MVLRPKALLLTKNVFIRSDIQTVIDRLLEIKNKNVFILKVIKTYWILLGISLSFIHKDVHIILMVRIRNLLFRLSFIY